MSVEASSPSGFPLKSRTRTVVLALVVLAVLPTVVAGTTAGALPTSAGPGATPSLSESPNLTALAVQGGEVGDGSDSRVLLFDPDTGQAEWERTSYETYYDVDPLGDSTLLYVGMTDEDDTYAVEHDWRTDDRRELFDLPFDSHDVDSLGDGEYAYVDGKNDTAVVYDARNDSVVWSYDFKKHYPPTAGNGPPSDYSGDYTHLNDIDAVDNGSQFLLSPRNFDRVMLVDRESKTVEWTLGEEDDYDVLNQQHNPTLLSNDPPTVLVADSENDRIVEYRRTGGEWDLVWEYRDDLVWPRDADRLPNGNTLIVDSRGAREVTPSRDTVWEADVPRFVYDAERVRLGDEPGGPSMAEYGHAFESATDERESGGALTEATSVYSGLYDTTYWVLPWWLGESAFATLVPGLVLLVGWCNVELRETLRGREWPSATGLGPSRGLFERGVPGSAMLAAGGLLAVGGVVSRLVLGTAPTTPLWNWVPAYLTLALLFGLDGLARLRADGRSSLLARSHAGLATGTILVGAAFAAVGTAGWLGWVSLQDPPSLLAFSSVVVFGITSVARQSARPLVGLETSPNAATGGGWLPYLAGVGVVGFGLFVLAQGLQSAIFPLSYLALAFVLLLEGDRLLATATRPGGHRPGVRSALGVFRYVLRPVWLALAAALTAKILGAGAMGSVMANLHLFNPVTVGFTVFVLARLIDSVTGAGTPKAVSTE